MLGNENTTVQGTQALSAPQEEVQVARNVSCQELPRERKRWIRPHIIGQASAVEHSMPGPPSVMDKSPITWTATECSYKSLPEYSDSWSDMPAFAFQHHLQAETFGKANLTPVASQPLSFPFDTRLTMNKSSASAHFIENQKAASLSVENAFSVVYSESKVEKQKQSNSATATNIQGFSVASGEASVTIPESPNARAPSPASVSSVTSSRRLEWDSGADVGYLAYQISDEFSISGRGMSTIERIALAQGCSTALSMRLEPEGTICPVQPSSNALSLSNQIKRHKNSHQMEHSKAFSADCNRMKYLADSATTSGESENEAMLTSNDSKSDHDHLSIEEKDIVFQGSNTDDIGKFLGTPKEQQHGNGKKVKKLSSSLSSLNEMETQHRNSDMLHRSRSQISVLTECVDLKTGYSSHSLPPQKNSNAITNSLSSSSLATVVSKQDHRKTSNKRTQTSPYGSLKQSIAVQMHDNEYGTEQNFPEKSDKRFQDKHSYFEHTGSTDDSDLVLEGTFDVTKSNEASKVGRSKHNSAAKALVSQQLKSAFEKQSMNGSCNQAKNSSSQDRAKLETYVQASSVKTSPEDNNSSKHQLPTNAETQNPSPSADNNLQGNDSWFLNEETPLERAGFNDTSQRGSMDAIDSAQSFEYLPGHIFEDMKINVNNDVINEVSSSIILQQDDVEVASSESSASNTFSRDLDRIVAQVTNYLNGRPHSCSEKKKLVQKIVKRLLETKYTDDSSSRESLELTRHREESVPYSPGVASEKSNETMSLKQSDNNKVLQKSLKHDDSKFQLHAHQTPVHLNDKCIGTVSSEESTLPSTSHSAAVEVAVCSCTEGTEYTGAVSTATSTTCNSNCISWKRRSVKLEKEYELSKQNQKQNQSQSVLLNFCKTERENQLSWICTEIRHLNRLKQLLEDQEKLLDAVERKSKLQGVKNKHVKSLHSPLTDTRGTETSDAKFKSLLEDQEKLLEAMERKIKPRGDKDKCAKLLYSSLTDTTSTQMSNTKSKRFLEAYSSTSTDREISLTEKRSAVFNKACRSREMYRVFDFNTSKAHCLHMKSSGLQDMSKIEHKVPITKDKSPLSKQKYIKKLKEEVQTKMSKDEGVQTSLRSNSSSSFKTFVVSENSQDNISSGRINVCIQTKDKISSCNGLKDYKISKGSESHKLSAKMPLCCCECKKLCEEVKTKLMETNKLNALNQSKCRCVRSVSHESTDDKLSSYGTLNDATELTKDSECHAHMNSLKEARVLKTAENAGVQTTLSFKEIPGGKPDCTKSDKNKQACTENHSKETSCLCHKLIRNGLTGVVESQAAQIQDLEPKSVVQQESVINEKLSSDSGLINSYHKINELKSKKSHNSKKYAVCGTSTSESSKSKHANGNVFSNGYQKGLSSSSTSVGSSLELRSKEPIAYILTLESASEMSIPEPAERKQLKEIVMKVPVKKKMTPSSAEKRRQAKASASKENHRPKHKPHTDKGETSNGTKSLTLQEYLKINRPDFIESAEQRRSCLDDLARMREVHQKSKRERLAMATHVNPTIMKDVEDLSRPPLAIKRVFSQRTMRAQTEQKYRKLPEMQVKKVERKKKEEFRTNRLMAQIFAKKLQRKALRGEVSLSNSKSVISTL